MPETSEFFSDRSIEPTVRGTIHRPESCKGDGLILTHGAGSNAQAPLLIALAEAFSAAGIIVLRCDLPYRQLRPHGPPGPGDAARDRKGLKTAVAALRKLARRRIFLGGHSYGGRQSTMLCAEEPELVDGLLLLSYPLHPPRKPEQVRTQHFPSLRNRSLFVHGTRDPFGSVEEIQNALPLIPADTRLLSVEGGAHDLMSKSNKGNPALASVVVAAFQEFFGSD
jgi:predicted alpha/beta-hydrolase family hydrolase